MTVHINQGARERIVKARAGEPTTQLTDAIAKAVRAQNLKVKSDGGGADGTDLPVRIHTDDDGSAAVVLAHPSGKAQQARHGALPRAAASRGLEARSKAAGGGLG